MVEAKGLGHKWLAKEARFKLCRSRRKEAWFCALSKPPYVGSWYLQGVIASLLGKS